MKGNGQRQRPHKVLTSGPLWRDTSLGTLNPKGGQGQSPLGIWEVTPGLDPIAGTPPPPPQRFLPDGSRAQSKVLLCIGALCGVHPHREAPEAPLRSPMFPNGLPLRQLQRLPLPSRSYTDVTQGMVPSTLGFPPHGSERRASPGSLHSLGDFCGDGSHTAPPGLSQGAGAATVGIYALTQRPFGGGFHTAP